MDTLQAAILQSRLGSLLPIIERRRKNADLYRELLNQDIVELPHCRECEFNTFHLFVIQVDERNALMEYLTKRGIETNIHYPVPIHLQPAAAELGYKPGDLPVAERQADRILSLPIHQFLAENDVIYVSETINRFYK
jgi:dTDP-4-amino-4,6-dideoxygalactose transaminase